MIFWFLNLVVWLITWGIYCTFLKPTALRRNYVGLRRFCFCQLGPKVKKIRQLRFTAKSMLLGQSKTKMDFGGFDIWHHGGENRTKISYKIPNIKENISQRRPTRRPTRPPSLLRCFLRGIRCEGSLSEYIYPRMIYSTYLLISRNPVRNQCVESISWELFKRLGHEMDWSFVDMQR